MEYIIKAGSIYPKNGETENAPALARIKNPLHGARRQILLPDGSVALQAEIEGGSGPSAATPRRYLLTRPDGSLAAAGRPAYAAGESPAENGWPLAHLPRMDHVDLQLEGEACVLEMCNSQNYELRAEGGVLLLQLLHRGILGGWDLRCHAHFEPPLLCGLLVFCLYLDQENEFLMV